MTVPRPDSARDEILAALRARKGCEDAGWWEGYAPLRPARSLKQDAEEEGAGDATYRLDVLRGPGRGDPVVAIDQARVRLDWWLIREGCRMLGKIVPLRGNERVRRVGVQDSAASLDLEWGRATDISVEVTFGGTGTRGAASRIANPIMFDDGERLSTRRTGSYTVFFYKGARLVNIDGGALPPIESFAD